MRLTSAAARRPWLAVPLLLSIASVMALSSASLFCDNDNKDSSNNCPSLASVDTRSVVRIPSLERPGELGLLGPLAAAPEEDDTLLSRTNTPTPTPTPKPKQSSKPKPKPRHKTKSTSSKQKSKTKSTASKPHATPHHPTTSIDKTPNPNRTKTHTATTTAHVVVPATTTAQPPPTASPGPTEQTTGIAEPTSTDSVAPPPAMPTAGEPTTDGTTHGSSAAIVTPAPTPTESTVPVTTTPTQSPEETTTFSRPNHPPRETVSDSLDVPTHSPKTEPTPAATSTLTVNSTTTTMIVLPSATTTPIPRTTPTTPSATMTATQPATTSPSTTTTSHHTRPTTTTTPWLPSTIEPLAAPKTTSTIRPGTSLPDIVIPNLYPDIPANSFNVVLRLEHVSYYQVINNGVLAAQLVSFLPSQLGRLLKVDTSLIQVLAIRDGSSKPLSINGATAPPPVAPRSRRKSTLTAPTIAKSTKSKSASTAATTATATKSKRSVRKRGLVISPDSSDAILVTVSIPRNKYWPLNNLVVNRNSDLYVQEAQSFGQFMDSEYVLASHPPSRSRGGDEGGDDGDITADPLTGDNPSLIPGPDGNKGGSSNSSHAPIIGSVVALATIAYVGIAIVVVRRIQAKKLREQQEREAIRQNISGPINVQGGANGWGWHGE
ncbi:hypothetical protein BGZ96_008873 [Linnemannia gamsii]|uniref:Mid2 domain-containing protein n=1 Tax=Linnemannia gamsii TaxID=64522 RepID=A0ABQ7JXD4_9FUNG|nr:hypothetical protein BGZ96_008873 [Linnemannia gamsii]